MNQVKELKEDLNKFFTKKEFKFDCSKVNLIIRHKDKIFLELVFNKFDCPKIDLDYLSPIEEIRNIISLKLNGEYNIFNFDINDSAVFSLKNEYYFNINLTSLEKIQILKPFNILELNNNFTKSVQNVIYLVNEIY